MSEAEKPRTLFERAGGEEGVTRMVNVFYDRVLEDPELAPFFERSPMDRLRRMQYEFFAVALDGPAQYTGQPLSAAHFGRGIEPAHLGRFLGHLFDVLKLQLTEREVSQVIARINLYAEDITGSCTVDG